MKNLVILLALAASTSASAQTIAVTNAEAWTMESDQPVSGATILIEDGRILSVTAGGAVPADATVIDARGKPVTPGLVNAATQIGLLEVASSTDTRDDASTDERTPGFDPSRALNGNSTLVSLARADGITRALIYPSPARGGPLSGEPSFARLRDGVNILDRSSVAIYTVIGGGAWDRLGARAQQWTVLRKLLSDARRAVPPPAPEMKGKRKSKPAEPAPGANGPSGGPSMPPGGGASFGDVVTGKLPLAIQTNRESDIREAAALAKEFGVKVIIVGGAEAWRAADVLAAAKVAVVLDPLANLPFFFDQVGARQDNAVILTRAGVPVAFGLAGGLIHSTYNAGMALREGAGVSVANGLTHAEALRAVTVNPLSIWGRGGGTLAPGSDADLVVWDGDPLEPSTNAVAVIVEGRQTSIRSRQDMLAERYKGAR